MTITRVGFTDAYADGWDKAFGSKKKRVTKSAAKASSAKGSAVKTKKKVAKKKTTKKAKR